jgi:UDP-N-acetylmuramoylalanine--D-glutamate ligase
LGEHNRKNLALVLHHLKEMEVLGECQLMRLSELRGLPHRLEYCGTFNGHIFINDSKATSFAAVVEALKSVEKSCILILQGVPKGDPSKMLQICAEKCKRVHLVSGMRELVGGFKNLNIEVHQYENMVDGFDELVIDADLLFSPGAPSYDQYRNYEDRGHHFKSLCELWRKNQ